MSEPVSSQDNCKDPKFWYEAVIVGNHPDHGSQTVIVNVLEDNSTLADALAEQTCEEWQNCIGVYYRGTYEEYLQWSAEEEEATKSGSQVEFNAGDGVPGLAIMFIGGSAWFRPL